MEFFFLGFFAFLAGFVDAVVGGGGLIQLPALLLFLPGGMSADVPSVFGTNKASSICGTSVAVIQYSQRIPIPWRTLLPATVAAFLFAAIGAMAVSQIRSDLLRPVVLFLLIGVAIYTAARKDLGDVHRPQFSPGRERILAIASAMGIGFYDGFFGPGTGSFLIFLFVGLFGFDFLTASASAKTINLCTNLSAVLYFAGTGQVFWKYALPMAICNMAGAWVGSRLAILKGNRFVRLFFLVIVTILIFSLAWEMLKNPL